MPIERILVVEDEDIGIMKNRLGKISCSWPDLGAHAFHFKEKWHNRQHDKNI